MNEKISIIIPAYNIERELPATLDNVLAQTYEKLEIIVVDDGSGDGTAAVIDDYAARFPNIRAIHKENGGVTSARLRGVEEATGDWIGFVDGDDLIAPEMYQRLIKNALDATQECENPRIELSAGINAEGKNYIQVSDNGTGIPADVQERIFIPFFTTKPVGSGIGLSISRQIMYMHKGSLTVISEAGKGSRFLLTFA